MEICEANTLPVQFIEVWSLKQGIAVNTQIAIPLIIRHQDNNVGLLTSRTWPGTSREQREEDG